MWSSMDIQLGHMTNKCDDYGWHLESCFVIGQFRDFVQIQPIRSLEFRDCTKILHQYDNKNIYY